MRCYICNKILNPNEIVLTQHKRWEPCNTCKNASKKLPSNLAEFAEQTLDNLTVLNPYAKTIDYYQPTLLKRIGGPTIERSSPSETLAIKETPSNRNQE